MAIGNAGLVRVLDGIDNVLLVLGVDHSCGVFRSGNDDVPYP
jgi:hypothetical protein